MKLLLDTHLLLWAAGEPGRLSKDTRDLIENAENELLFSAASLWEVVTKRGLGREDFEEDPRLFRRGLPADNWTAGLFTLSWHILMYMPKAGGAAHAAEGKDLHEQPQSSGSLT